MKHTIALLSLLFAITTAAAPGDASFKTSVTFAWDEPPAGVDVSGYVLYSRTNLSLGNWMAMSPTFTGSATSAVVNVSSFIGWPAYKGPWFFALTATNMWGESDFSSTVSVSRLPQGGSNFKIKSIQ